VLQQELPRLFILADRVEDGHRSQAYRDARKPHRLRQACDEVATELDKTGIAAVAEHRVPNVLALEQMEERAETFAHFLLVFRGCQPLRQRREDALKRLRRDHLEEAIANLQIFERL
jgi:hypothetical protein